MWLLNLFTWTHYYDWKDYSVSSYIGIAFLSSTLFGIRLSGLFSNLNRIISPIKYCRLDDTWRAVNKPGLKLGIYTGTPFRWHLDVCSALSRNNFNSNFKFNINLQYERDMSSRCPFARVFDVSGALPTIWVFSNGFVSVPWRSVLILCNAGATVCFCKMSSPLDAAWLPCRDSCDNRVIRGYAALEKRIFEPKPRRGNLKFEVTLDWMEGARSKTTWILGSQKLLRSERVLWRGAPVTYCVWMESNGALTICNCRTRYPWKVF